MHGILNLAIKLADIAFKGYGCDVIMHSFDNNFQWGLVL